MACRAVAQAGLSAATASLGRRGGLAAAAGRRLADHRGRADPGVRPATGTPLAEVPRLAAGTPAEACHVAGMRTRRSRAVHAFVDVAPPAGGDAGLLVGGDRLAGRRAVGRGQPQELPSLAAASDVAPATLHAAGRSAGTARAGAPGRSVGDPDGGDPAAALGVAGRAPAGESRRRPASAIDLLGGPDRSASCGETGAAPEARAPRSAALRAPQPAGAASASDRARRTGRQRVRLLAARPAGCGRGAGRTTPEFRRLVHRADWPPVQPAGAAGLGS